MPETNQPDEENRKALAAKFLAEGIPPEHLYRQGVERPSTEALEARFVRMREATEREGFLQTYMGFTPKRRYQFIKEMLELASTYQELLIGMDPGLRENEEVIRRLEGQVQRIEANAIRRLGSRPDIIIEHPKSNTLALLAAAGAGYFLGK